MRIRDCIIEDDLRQRSQNDSLISEDFEGMMLIFFNGLQLIIGISKSIKQVILLNICFSNSQEILTSLLNPFVRTKILCYSQYVNLVYVCFLEKKAYCYDAEHMNK